MAMGRLGDEDFALQGFVDGLREYRINAHSNILLYTIRQRENFWISFVSPVKAGHNRRITNSDWKNTTPIWI